MHFAPWSTAQKIDTSEGLWREDPAQLERILDRAVETARRAGRSDVESRCLSSKGFKAGREGRPDEAVELLRTALAVAGKGVILACVPSRSLQPANGAPTPV